MNPIIDQIKKVVDEEWKTIHPFVKEQYERDADGFQHSTKKGLVLQIYNEMEDEGIEFTEDNIYNMYYDLV